MDLLLKTVDLDKLDELRVTDLRAHLKHRGLLVSGTKAKLIERLLAHENGTATSYEYSNSLNRSINVSSHTNNR